MAIINGICEECLDTGWYGDNGPGIKGNKEYVQCECDPMLRAQRKLSKDLVQNSNAAAKSILYRKER